MEIVKPSGYTLSCACAIVRFHTKRASSAVTEVNWRQHDLVRCQFLTAPGQYNQLGWNGVRSISYMTMVWGECFQGFGRIGESRNRDSAVQHVAGCQPRLLQSMHGGVTEGSTTHYALTAFDLTIEDLNLPAGNQRLRTAYPALIGTQEAVPDPQRYKTNEATTHVCPKCEQ